MRVRLRILSLLLLAGGPALPLAGQDRVAVERERTEFAAWLRDAPVSPWRAIVVRPIGAGITLGPESADIPLAGVAESRLTERGGRIVLRTGARELGLSRGRVQTLEGWSLLVSGPPGRGAVTVYGPAPPKPKKLHHYPYDPRNVFLVSLRPAGEARTQRLLTPDGVEVDAGEAGTIELLLGKSRVTLRVRRLPGATEDESELEIFFRDGTSGKGSYPAGRFVSLIPRPDGRMVLDFNRARSPFCAYNTVYPCPAPWGGNSLTQAVKAGERYEGGGLEVKIP